MRRLLNGQPVGAPIKMDSSTHLLERWRTGDQGAADELFHRYVGRLVALARSRLSGQLAARVDPEDVVQSAYRSFFAHARDGAYDLRRSGDLWRLLLAITLHKLHDHVRHHTAQKRDAQNDVPFGSEDSLLNIQAHLPAPEPSPVEAMALVDEVQEVMRRLTPLHRRMLELRLQGYSAAEIATETGRCAHTVRRVLEQVKRELEAEMRRRADS
jgi:RNA polymerase sigma factor (sigma-70 family)